MFQLSTRLVVFTLLMGFSRRVITGVVLGDFQREALMEHNCNRQLHCVTSMVLNATLNGIAQTYAESLAATQTFVHSGRAGLGENLWATSSSAVLGYINGSTPTDTWYNEVSKYSFTSPGFSAATGHFTQLVWNATTQMGIGIAFTSDTKSAYVVANYYPAGNVIGAFPANVPPLCSKTTTANSSALLTVHTNAIVTSLMVPLASLLRAIQ